MVTNSIASFLIGERLRSHPEYRVIHAFGYPFPRPRYGEEYRAGEAVFVLADIYSTGVSINHLRRQILTARAEPVDSFALVDAHGGAAKDGVRSAVELHIPLVETSPDDPTSRHELLLDPFSCLPFSVGGDRRVETGLLDQRFFWRIATEKKALSQGHYVYNGGHFSLFVETRLILRDRNLLRDFVSRSLLAVGQRFDLILCPKNEGALLFAKAVQDYILDTLACRPPELIPVARDHERKLFRLPQPLRGQSEAPSVLLVDDGANTGQTLAGLYFAAEILRPRRLRAVVFLDRLVGTDRQIIRRLLGNKYKPVFHLPIPVYREWDCPVCISAESQFHYSGGERSGAALTLRAGPPRALSEETEHIGR